MKPETIALVSAVVAALSAAGSIASAVVSYFNGKRQVEGAQAAAQRQIESAQAVAKQQIGSAQAVAHKQLVMPMREAWIGTLREKLAFYMATCTATFSGEITSNNAERLRLLSTRYEIVLMLNLLDEGHRLLDKALNDMLRDALAKEKQKFDHSSRIARSTAFMVLRQEWVKATGEEQPQSSIETEA
jgi:hypothetical protein